MYNLNMTWRALGAAAIALLFTTAVFAQQPGRIRGQIEKTDGSTLSLKTRDGSMLDALAAAARATQGLKPLATEKRDLFKQPMTARELEAFDAVVLDPPRAGAQAQATQLAQSRIKRIAYVSCDPASFARDARILVNGGYRMGAVTPVDQFLWSSHIELVGGFHRPKG